MPRRILAILFLIAAGFFAIPDGALAATLDLSPLTGTYAPGATFPLRVRVSSTDEAMNAVSGTVVFPEDLLEVVSLSKADSIISLWVQEPSYSNANGTVNFEGIVLNPGFTGSAGRILTIQFRAKARGQANINFTSSSVLANDGKGTNILTTTGNSQITVGAGVPVESAPSTEDGPVVTSSTHPDQNKWYQLNDVEVAWPLPENVNALRILLDKLPRSTPTVSYEEPFTSRRFENVDDGLWYFHIRFRKGDTWGPVTNYRLQIDNEKPRFFDLTESPREDATDPRAVFTVNAADDISGIDHYEFTLDSADGVTETWKDDGKSRYTMKPLPPGKHLLYGKVFDRAGNSLANSVEFEIAGLEAPSVTEYPSQVEENESFSVSGKSKYPNAAVRLVFTDGADVHTIDTGKTDDKGNFTVFVGGNTIPRGSYDLEAVIVDSRGAQSYPSKAVKFGVVQNILFRIGSFTVSLLTILVPLFALLFLLLFILWYAWHKFMEFRKKLSREVREAETSLHRTFDKLREDIRDHVKLLEKAKSRRELTAEEEKVIKLFKRHLDDAETYVEKEIKDIEELKIRFK
ncbi:hypothetical protein KW797_03545 [Candidatus Parcubacteria bacterium]|nr:hypothetical protein [Candidatus Parcubacteria bacterium]